MGAINIANSAGRDAVVNTESVRSPLKVRWVDRQGRQAESVRVVKAPIDRGIERLRQTFGELSDVSQALVDGDPEIDLENTGRFLKNTSRVYVDQQQEIVHKVEFWEIVRNPDGSVRERRPRKLLDPNVAGEIPLRWSGVYIDKAEAVRKFVFAGKVQLHHINGLTYDFLYGMAKELEDRNSLMLIGAGPKSNQPLILRRGSTPYRGFLEGRTDGDKYCLLLHFSNMELKAPEESSPEEKSEQEGET
ncbi:MAG: hypothetical protein RIC55_25630 [Pirellulaceae bacterium]